MIDVSNGGLYTKDLYDEPYSDGMVLPGTTYGFVLNNKSIEIFKNGISIGVPFKNVGKLLSPVVELYGEGATVEIFDPDFDFDPDLLIKEDTRPSKDVKFDPEYSSSKYTFSEDYKVVYYHGDDSSWDGTALGTPMDSYCVRLNKNCHGLMLGFATDNINMEEVTLKI
jgi:hypothetical protein